MADWKIEGNGARLVIEVLSYERESAIDESDANWLRCKAQGIFDGFSCKCEYSILTNDFREFEASLRGMIEGRSANAYFSTTEEGLGLELERDSAGHCKVSGFLRSFGMPKSKLEFVFESDQSYLRQTLAELVRVNERFPVRAA